MQPGISDDVVLDLANQHSALLITADKDFGELVFRLRRLRGGVILLRLAGLSPERKAEIVILIINQHLEELVGAFTAGRIRFSKKKIRIIQTNEFNIKDDGKLNSIIRLVRKVEKQSVPGLETETVSARVNVTMRGRDSY
jgi:predicted nuclease of predicted toxin-antitoxin system